MQTSLLRTLQAMEGQTPTRGGRTYHNDGRPPDTADRVARAQRARKRKVDVYASAPPAKSGMVPIAGVCMDEGKYPFTKWYSQACRMHAVIWKVAPANNNRCLTSKELDVLLGMWAAAIVDED